MKLFLCKLLKTKKNVLHLRFNTIMVNASIIYYSWLKDELTYSQVNKLNKQDDKPQLPLGSKMNRKKNNAQYANKENKLVNVIGKK